MLLILSRLATARRCVHALQGDGILLVSMVYFYAESGTSEDAAEPFWECDTRVWGPMALRLVLPFN